jgi:hypothetical protein
MKSTGRNTDTFQALACSDEEFVMVQPAAKKRGADPHVPVKSKRLQSANPTEQKLEQGLEESMAGSDPVSVSQPAPLSADKRTIATDKK